MACFQAQSLINACNALARPAACVLILVYLIQWREDMAQKLHIQGEQRKKRWGKGEYNISGKHALMQHSWLQTRLPGPIHPKVLQPFVTRRYRRPSACTGMLSIRSQAMLCNESFIHAQDFSTKREDGE